jgi:short subunit dehydrogenase-like uncharacterized protein
LAEAPLAVLGATGYTGRLVCTQARMLGLPVRLVGRDPRRLSATATAGDEVRIADARDAGALRRAFEGAFAVASCAGPFVDLGLGPPEAAVAVGAHYLDTSGEQAFGRLVHERLGAAALERGVVLLPMLGIEYAIGDLGARLAADGQTGLDEVVVGYSVRGRGSSRGTRRTVARIMTQPLVAWSGGRLVPSRFGATVRRLEFPDGETDVVEWGGGEPLTVPLHTAVPEVRSYVRAPALAAHAGRAARLLAPLARARAAAAREGPSEAERAAKRFAVVAEARGPAGRRRATLTGRNTYGITALLVARAAEALRAGEVRASGALAPAQALDAHVFAERLSPLLERVDVREL